MERNIPILRGAVIGNQMNIVSVSEELYSQLYKCSLYAPPLSKTGNTIAIFIFLNAVRGECQSNRDSKAAVPHNLRSRS